MTELRLLSRPRLDWAEATAQAHTSPTFGLRTPAIAELPAPPTMLQQTPAIAELLHRRPPLPRSYSPPGRSISDDSGAPSWVQHSSTGRGVGCLLVEPWWLVGWVVVPRRKRAMGRMGRLVRVEGPPRLRSCPCGMNWEAAHGRVRPPRLLNWGGGGGGRVGNDTQQCPQRCKTSE